MRSAPPTAGGWLQLLARFEGSGPPDVTVISVVKIGSFLFRWTFDTEISFIDVVDGLEINAVQPIDFPGIDTFSVDVLYTDDASPGDPWAAVDAVGLFFINDGVIPNQTGFVT